MSLEFCIIPSVVKVYRWQNSNEFYVVHLGHFNMTLENLQGHSAFGLSKVHP